MFDRICKINYDQSNLNRKMKKGKSLNSIKMKAEHKRIDADNLRLMNRIVLTKPSSIILTATDKYLK